MRSFSFSPSWTARFASLGFLAVLSAGAQARTWTAKDGRTIEGEFVMADESSVTVRMGAREVVIPFEKLSDADADFAREKAADASRFDVGQLGEFAKFAEGEWVKGELEDLKFQIHAPATFKRDQKIPLVIFLHGVGERGEDNERQINGLPRTFASPENQTARPCIVVAPQCPPDVFWNQGDITKRIIALTETIAENMPVDEDRIYLSGFSMGGFGTWAVLGEAPKLFAAAVPIAGGGNPGIARDIKKVPIWNFHGDKDDAVDVKQSREMVEALEKVKAKITYTEFEGAGHGIADQVLNDPKVQEWLFSQTKAGS